MNRLVGVALALTLIGGTAFTLYYMRSSATLATAQMVASCEQTHHLRRQADSIHSENGTTLGSCEWPPPPWADRDGYSEIIVKTENGPGQNEATDADQADYITIPCKTVQISYDFGSQGVFEHRAPVSAHSGDVIGEDGVVSRELRANLPGYPSRDQVVYLHNMKLGLASARCVSGE